MIKNIFSFVSPYMLWIKIGFCVILATTSGYTGWKLNGWYNDSRDLAVLEQTAKLEAEFKTHEKNVATTLETKLKELKANERIINNEKLKIIDRPIYLNQCLDADGLRLSNKQRGVKDSDSGQSSD